MNLINCTPHSVDLIDEDGNVTSLPASGVLPRVAMTSEVIGTVQLEGGRTIPVRASKMGQLEGLPAPLEGVGLIVSRLAAEAARERRDLYFPDQVVRDEGGRIVGCCALAQADPA